MPDKPGFRPQTSTDLNAQVLMLPYLTGSSCSGVRIWCFDPHMARRRGPSRNVAAPRLRCPGLGDQSRNLARKLPQPSRERRSDLATPSVDFSVRLPLVSWLGVEGLLGNNGLIHPQPTPVDRTFLYQGLGFYTVFRCFIVTLAIGNVCWV